MVGFKQTELKKKKTFFKDLANKAKIHFFENEQLRPRLGTLRTSFLNLNEISDPIREKGFQIISQDISCHSDTRFGMSVELRMRWFFKNKNDTVFRMSKF